MAQLTHKKSSNKRKHVQNNSVNNLGQAPNDIYDLENEIAHIHSDSKEKEQTNYKSFSTTQISQAKQSLQTGSNIKVELPNNPSPHALIAMCHTLGFDTQPLQQIFANSSIAVKNILDTYVTQLKQKYASLSSMNHPYQSSVFGYLFHCKQIDALQCDDDLSAKIRIHLDLDYTNTVLTDDLFQSKFIYEMSNKVFKCAANNIRVQDVRAGSVIVVIAGITLVTLAAVGLLSLSVRLYQKKQKQSLIKTGLMAHDTNTVQIKDQKIAISPIKEQTKAKAKTDTPLEQIDLKKQTQATFVSSVFNKIKTGINSFNEQYSTPKGGDTSVNANAQLTAMGFSDMLSQKAAKMYPMNVNKAINWIMEHENDACPDIVEEESKSEVEKVEKKRENLMLHINDSLWVNRKSYFWTATVIALSRDKVTIEYDNGGPYLFRKTETFALNDECLIQRQPGSRPEYEGCVQISKGTGFIQGWRTGLDRAMVDI